MAGRPLVAVALASRSPFQEVAASRVRRHPCRRALDADHAEWTAANRVVGGGFDSCSMEITTAL